MSFTSTKKAGRIVKVSEFKWQKVPVTCDQGTSTFSGQFPLSLSVAKAKFGITVPGTGIVSSMFGQFADSGRSASGTMNVYGNLGLNRTNCATGKLQWSATRQ